MTIAYEELNVAVGVEATWGELSLWGSRPWGNCPGGIFQRGIYLEPPNRATVSLNSTIPELKKAAEVLKLRPKIGNKICPAVKHPVHFNDSIY